MYIKYANCMDSPTALAQSDIYIIEKNPNTTSCADLASEWGWGQTQNRNRRKKLLDML